MRDYFSEEILGQKPKKDYFAEEILGKKEQERDYFAEEVEGALPKLDFMQKIRQKLPTLAPVQEKIGGLAEKGLEKWREETIPTPLREAKTPLEQVDVILGNIKKQALSVPRFPIDIAQQIFFDEEGKVRKPAEVGKAVVKTGGEFLEYGRQNFENYATYISPLSSPEARKKAIEQIAEDPLGLFFCTAILKSGIKGGKKVYTAVKEVKRKRGLSIEEPPVEQVRAVTEIPEEIITEKPKLAPKKKVFGEAELKLAKELKAKGVTEKPAPTGKGVISVPIVDEAQPYGFGVGRFMELKKRGVTEKSAVARAKEPRLKYEASIGRSRSYVLDTEKQEIVQGSTFRGAGHAEKARVLAKKLQAEYPELKGKPKPTVKAPTIPAELEGLAKIARKSKTLEEFGETLYGEKAKLKRPFGEQSKIESQVKVAGGYGFKDIESFYRAAQEGRAKELRLEKIRREITDLGFLGTPEAYKALGESVVGGAKEISRLTSEMVKGMKTKPEVRYGVKEAKTTMIEHDRQIRRAESTSKLFEKVIKDVVPDKGRQMEMVHAYEHKMKGPYWEGLTDLEQSMVEWVSKEKAKLNKFIEKNDILEMMPESENINHIFHHWIDPKTGEPYKGMYGKFSKGLPQAKQRVIPTYESGIEKGLEPATSNIGKLVGLEWEAVTRAHQSREMFKTLHNIGAEKGVEIQLMKGKPAKPIRMVERWDLLQKQGLTEDYVRYSHPALDKAITFKDPSGTLIRLKGAVGVRKELYPFVRSYMESPNYGTFSKLNFATKSLKLGFSMFHVMSLGMQELANWRIPFKNIPRGLREVKNLGPELRLLHQEGLELFKGYEDIGYRNKFFEGSNWWSKMGNTVTKPIEAMRTFIFDIVQPGMKASFALDKYNELLPKYLKKGYTKEQCARAVVQAADGHFSGEHYKRSLLETNRFMVKMYFTPEARKAWQTALLSPTWQREHLLVAKNVAKSFMPDRFIKKLGLSEMGPIKGEFRKYLLGATMLIGAVDLYNLYSTQKMDGEAKHLWQNPEGKGFAVRAPWDEPGYTMIDKNGKERRVKGGPAYIRPLKSVFEVAEWVKTPFKKFVYKLSPIMTATGRQMWPSKYQKEYKGWPDMPRRVRDFVFDVGTPISASQMGGVVLGKKTPQAGIIPFFGFPTSKLSKEQTEKVYYRRLSDIYKKHGGRSGEWQRVRREFESMGYKFNVKKFRLYLEGK